MVQLFWVDRACKPNHEMNPISAVKITGSDFNFNWNLLQFLTFSSKTASRVVDDQWEKVIYVAIMLINPTSLVE
jgi:hypothetical protein